ncbi:GntR family transcriptional regulator [Thermomonospora umbrina]|uniref:GntR family transcriptional regulator n=1 Tax=Thermomonospora umbrina TaxID=111806 RepID=UPI001FE881D0|nr:GntR family transcriptional regulator [Thermomonospora umbrina]
MAADLRARIMAGDFQPGEQLGSTAQLMEHYQAANPTIQRALDVLKTEGFLYGRRGKGVYVRDKQPFKVDVAAYFTPSPDGFTYDLLDVTQLEPPPEVAQALGLDDSGEAILRRRITRYQGEPVEVCYSYYPLPLAAGTPLARAGKIKGGAPRVLANLGFPQVRFIDEVSARHPTTEEIELLDLPNVPVIRQFRTIYSHDDLPVEATVMIKGGNLYELRYRQVAD